MLDPVKVALLSDCYLPRLGGIEVQVHDLARALQHAGHDPMVISATAGPEAPIDGVPSRRFDLPITRGVPVNPFAPPAVRRLLSEGGFDVAHVHMGVVSPFAMDGMRVCLRLGLPTVVTWHCVLGSTVPLIGALGYVRRWAAAGALLTAVSQVAAQPLRRLAPRTEVEVLPNAIDPLRWAPTPRAPGRPEDGVRVVTAMRLARRKRPADLVRVMHRARAEGVDLRLDILGEGPQRRRLEAWSAAHDAGSWLSLPGRVDRDELHRRYLAADIYVSPAELEAFGIAALEARASGLPVVGPRRSGITEFIRDGVEGLLTEDDDQMAHALARLGADSALRERIRQHNVTTPVAQDWTSVADLTADTYRRVIARESPRSG